MAAGVAERLHRAGERVTPQRLRVARALEAGRQQTAEELWRQLQDRRDEIGRATVFRSLEALVSAGLAHRLEREHHVYAYVACRPEHHHHLACSACGRVLEIDESYVLPVAERVAAETGFVIDDARLDFYGRCRDCRR
jgi:Fur family ferric uptake transcriptional regulator